MTIDSPRTIDSWPSKTPFEPHVVWQDSTVRIHHREKEKARHVRVVAVYIARPDPNNRTSVDAHFVVEQLAKDAMGSPIWRELLPSDALKLEHVLMHMFRKACALRQPVYSSQDQPSPVAADPDGGERSKITLPAANAPGELVATARWPRGVEFNVVGDEPEERGFERGMAECTLPPAESRRLASWILANVPPEEQTGT
jgi:hypothetical protein